MLGRSAKLADIGKCPCAYNLKRIYFTVNFSTEQIYIPSFGMLIT